MGWSIRQYEVRVATTNKYIGGINIIKAELKTHTHRKSM
jgi:hypothetical protein